MQECKFRPENDEVELLGSNILICGFNWSLQHCS